MEGKPWPPALLPLLVITRWLGGCWDCFPNCCNIFYAMFLCQPALLGTAVIVLHWFVSIKLKKSLCTWSRFLFLSVKLNGVFQYRVSICSYRSSCTITSDPSHDIELCRHMFEWFQKSTNQIDQGWVTVDLYSYSAPLQYQTAPTSHWWGEINPSPTRLRQKLYPSLRDEMNIPIPSLWPTHNWYDLN